MATAIVLRMKLPTAAELLKLTRKPIAATADAAVSLIKRRTSRGTDSRGGSFAPYSEKYRLQRIASGRRGNPVDLTVTGALLGNLKRLRVDSNRRAVIGFEGQHRNTRFKATSRRGFLSDVASRKTVRKGTFRRAGSASSFGTTPYAVLVPALNRKRRFFAIESPAEIRTLVSIFQRHVDEEIRRHNAQNRGR
jgi:hypothetical protein